MFGRLDFTNKHRRSSAFTGKTVAKFSGASISNCGMRLHRSRGSGQPARHKGLRRRRHLAARRSNSYRHLDVSGISQNRMINTDEPQKSCGQTDDAAANILPLNSLERRLDQTKVPVLSPVNNVYFLRFGVQENEELF